MEPEYRALVIRPVAPGMQDVSRDRGERESDAFEIWRPPQKRLYPFGSA